MSHPGESKIIQGFYSGELFRGKAHGEGRFRGIDENHDVYTYIGLWLDDEISSYGTCTKFVQSSQILFRIV